jgi:hypothetical protein
MHTPNFIEVYENVASDRYCDEMIAHFENLYTGQKASIGGRMDGQETNDGTINRKDFAFFFDTDGTQELKSETYDILNTCLSKYCDKYPSIASMQLASQKIKVQKTFPKGGFHFWHCEQRGLHDMMRALAWTIYLNDIPEGEGETEFWDHGVRIQPKKGSVCLFPAGWTHFHRGNPVYSTEKYIATGWYYGDGQENY